MDRKDLYPLRLAILTHQAQFPSRPFIQFVGSTAQALCDDSSVEKSEDPTDAIDAVVPDAPTIQHETSRQHTPEPTRQRSSSPFDSLAHQTVDQRASSEDDGLSSSSSDHVEPNGIDADYDSDESDGADRQIVSPVRAAAMKTFMPLQVPEVIPIAAVGSLARDRDGTSPTNGVETFESSGSQLEGVINGLAIGGRDLSEMSPVPRPNEKHAIGVSLVKSPKKTTQTNAHVKTAPPTPSSTSSKEAHLTSIVTPVSTSRVTPRDGLASNVGSVRSTPSARDKSARKDGGEQILSRSSPEMPSKGTHRLSSKPIGSASKSKAPRQEKRGREASLEATPAKKGRNVGETQNATVTPAAPHLGTKRKKSSNDTSRDGPQAKMRHKDDGARVEAHPRADAQGAASTQAGPSKRVRRPTERATASGLSMYSKQR